MTDAAFLLDELDALAARAPAHRRERVLRDLADLFLASGGAMPPPAASLVDEMILRLSRVIEAGVRAVLAARLADERVAPARTLAGLVHDEADVARPLLERSPALGEDTLVSVAGSRGEAHRLAIAGRSRLSEPVTDILVERGGAGVLREVAANPGARFSERGFEGLVSRAGEDETLQLLLSERADLPLPQVRRLIDMAGGAALQRLRGTLEGIDPSLLGRSVTRELARAQAIAALATPTRDYREAHAAVRGLAASRQLTEADLAGFAREGRPAELVCALSAMTSLSVRTVEGILERGDHDQFLILSRGLGLGFETARAVMGATFPEPPSVQGAAELAARYGRITPKTAVRVMTFLADREGALNGEP